MKSLQYFYEQAADAQASVPKRVSDDVVTIFGRHNPPHLGHKLGLDHAHDIASGIGDKTPADQRFYTSRSNDPKKNPLPFQAKLKFLKKMFPDHAEKWDDNPDIKTLLHTAVQAHEDGYKNFHFVGGGDRKEAAENLFRKYNGQLYDFENIYSHNAGDREPDGDDPIAALSASKMRNFAMNDNFDEFQGGLPIGDAFGGGFTMDDAKDLFQQLKMYMQKNEEYSPDEMRDLYKAGRLFQEGDRVESLTTCMRGDIHRCGTNHVIVVTEDGIMFKSFVHDLMLV